ncbi:MAG: pyridoxamine 5'-phosphate oxidase family protein [Syntrophobacteraceae bacterium]|nr:pyridoxamine 5'-phosphate oxidase family protein [Syntrophobacteraceae bacterium]
MRRSDREIMDRRAIDDIIRRSRVCRLGLCHGGLPYIVPMCFGYDGAHLYLHAAAQGRKIDILGSNNLACFEFDILHEVTPSDRPCGWGMKYESVVGFGTAELIRDPGSREQALGWIMRQYGVPEEPFSEASLDRTLIIRVTIQEITGKACL